MHICYLTNEYPKEGFAHGGIGTFVKTIANALVKQGVKVSIVGMNYTDNYEEQNDNGISIYRLKKSQIKGLAWASNFKAINNKIEEIDKIHTVDIVETSELGLAFISKIKRIKYVIRLHGGHHFFAESENRGVDFWKGFQEKKSFANADAFIAVSKYVKSQTELFLSYNNKPLEYINYPIDTFLFKPIKNNNFEHKIIFVGTLCEKKGLRQLIQSFPDVIKKIPNVVLEIYGRDWFYPDGTSYLKMLKEKELPQLGELAEKIFFKGAASHQEIPQIYSTASVCVFPSHMETQGLVAPEAMAMEKVVIFTQLGPGPETISNYETGLLCNPHNPKDIAEKIIWVLSNKDKAEVIENAARKYVVKTYSLSLIVQKNINFYNSLISI